MKTFATILILGVSVIFAVPKSAGAYYSDAAFQYIESRLPTAEITCKEGLSYYPGDSKLQMLLDRIQEAKDEQKNQNKNQDKNKDQDQKKDQDQNQNQSQGANSSQNSANSSDSEGSPESSDSQGQNEPPQQLPPGALSPEQASQLLKDFDEENGEHKPWKPVRGMVRPEKDW